MKYEEIKTGTQLPQISINLNLLQLVTYCGATWDFARFHFDPDYARRFGLAGPAADPQMHGAFIARMLTEWMSDSARIRKLALDYRLPSYVGDILKYGGEIVNKYQQGEDRYAECVIEVTNQKGEHPVTGKACLLFY